MEAGEQTQTGTSLGWEAGKPFRTDTEVCRAGAVFVSSGAFAGASDVGSEGKGGAQDDT